MIILKLGGSILTNKNSKDAEINYTNLNRITIEIKDALDHIKINNNTILVNQGLIIIHGAGSYGHPPAKKYNIGVPFPPEEYPEKRIGFSKTQNCVKKLNTIVCETFVDNELPCVSIQPSSFITTKNKRINTFDMDLMEKYMKEGFIPVMHGDVVLDDELKFVVLSGDQILQYIAKNIAGNSSNSSEKEVILGTDINGVFTKNPKKYGDAKHIPKLKSLDDVEIFDSTTNIDVTGGMIGKIKELLELAENGIKSTIINANESGAIFNALSNRKVRGTVIKWLK